ncbi:TorF family putative porin [Pontiella sulfatireligans]|uniref:Uncharacterized protein n=1 Tax=Pontiella sulfatireligans TaxID=2750658 RepID=A0A6C2UI18_9BACT|nr:TorF family putative porin [Pontiella sulfatireligans]VGO19862.1 hypothetical protein SCARR_01922 [Pontiella sulfatireligans]
MKKMMTIGLAAVFAAGFAGAQDDVVIIDQSVVVEPVETHVTAEVAVMSSYVWRGQVYNNDMVIQPQISVSDHGVSLNIWGNYDIGHNNTDNNGDFSEIDFSLAYTLPIDINEMAFDIGLINYNFPNSDGDSTTELFGTATILSWKDYVVPSFTIFGDIDEADGIYALFDIVAPFQISDYFAVEAGFSMGYGDSSYNSYYWTNEDGKGADKGINDYNFYCNASYELAENLTASVNLTYTMLEGGSVRDAANDNYEAKDKVWGGVNLAYSF